MFIPLIPALVRLTSLIPTLRRLREEVIRRAGDRISMLLRLRNGKGRKQLVAALCSLTFQVLPHQIFDSPFFIDKLNYNASNLSLVPSSNRVIDS